MKNRISNWMKRNLASIVVATIMSMPLPISLAYLTGMRAGFSPEMTDYELDNKIARGADPKYDSLRKKHNLAVGAVVGSVYLALMGNLYAPSFRRSNQRRDRK